MVNMLLTSSHDDCLVNRELCDVLVISVDDNDGFRCCCFDGNSADLRE